MARVAVAAAVVIALAAGVWLLWPEDEPAPTTTLPVAGSSTTDSPTTSSPPSTTSTTEDSHLVETVEEAEAILRDFWLGWYGGFYNEDPDLIREVVATEDQVQTAVSRFGTLNFTKAPTAPDFVFEGTEILRSDDACLAIWAEFTPPFLMPVGSTSGVQVFRNRDGTWKSLSYWKYKADLWEEDCAVVFQP